MNQRQLEAFHAVMTTGSTSQAARSLHVTQPAVSALISNLEKTIGFDLFERRRGRLEPTPEADYLFEQVSRIFESLNGLTQSLHDIQSLKTGYLRIACMPGPSLFLVPRLVSRFLRDKPDVQVALQTRSSIKVRDWIAMQQYDVGLAEVPITTPAIDYDPISLGCVCAMPVGHPLSDKPVITPEDLDGEPLVALYPDHMTHQDTRRAFETAGARFHVRFETQIFIPAFTFVEDGLALSIVDPMSAECYRIYRGEPRIVFRRFRPRVALNVAVLYPAHRPRSRLAKLFGALLYDGVVSLNAALDGAALSE